MFGIKLTVALLTRNRCLFSFPTFGKVSCVLVLTLNVVIYKWAFEFGRHGMMQIYMILMVGLVSYTDSVTSLV